MPVYRNISFATVESMAEVLQSGVDINVRGERTRELVNWTASVDRPFERYLFLPRRLNNVFAQFAESMWVISGRNDVAWLSRYLPRAIDYSDDGQTWRGAYGPRLRCWDGKVDQVNEVRQLLLEDVNSRRAVMTLYDPAVDFVKSKDIPCNNWLSWIARDGKLHLSVAIRSNDAMWGFSGINSFEWSILQEMMAYWLRLEVGLLNFFATSFHIYDKHLERAKQIGAGFDGLTPYDFGVSRASFETPWEEFAAKLDYWFSLEESIRSNPNCSIFSYGRTKDPLLDSGLALVHVYWAFEQWGIDRAAKELGDLPEADYVVAMYEYLGRKTPELLERITQPAIRRYFEVNRSNCGDNFDLLKSAIKKLHAYKDQSYGSSWKRRGDLLGILLNIARKSDRLETMLSVGAKMHGEAAFDTAIDLLVYVEKYRLYLAEKLDEGALLPRGSKQPLSDHLSNFDALIDQLALEPTGRSSEVLIREVVTRFDACWHCAEAAGPRAEQLKAATQLSSTACELVAKIMAEDKATARRFIQTGFSQSF